MPGKKKGKAKGGKRKKSGKKDIAAEGETRSLLKTYEKNCALVNSQTSPGIKKLLKAAAEEDKAVTKFILESVLVEKEGDLPVLFDPLIVSLRHERYKHIRDIHVWDYPMSQENVATLALFLEKPFYPIRLIELMDCMIDAPSVPRLARSLCFCDFLTTLHLDYNEFGDEGCRALAEGLVGNVTVLSLSLCYCNLKIASGQFLGNVVSTTAIMELYLDGNELESEGTIELIKLIVDQAETDAYMREQAAIAEQEALAAEKASKSNRFNPTSGEGTESEKETKNEEGGKKKKKKKGKKKKKKPVLPPPVGPYITKLHLADNGIDSFGVNEGFPPVICMRLFKKLLMHCKDLQELDLNGNLITELGGREILAGLEYRKEAKLGGVKVQTTHKMTSATFNSVIKLGSGGLRKKKKKGKKKKKK